MKGHRVDDHSFYSGVICALAVLDSHGQDTIYDEIVDSIGNEELIFLARKDGSMKWSGLSRCFRRNRP